MKITIIHLSDIHLKVEDNYVFNIQDKLLDSISQFSSDTDLLIVAITGDIAQSGQREEYYHAWTFFSDLIEKIQSQFTKVEFFFVPGNHDCYFSNESNIRETILNKVISSLDFKDEFLKLLLECQNEYYDFESELLNYDEKEQDIRNKIFCTKIITYNDYNISVNLINNSFCSQLQNVQGKIVYPTELITSESSSELSITLFHHPYNWLESNNAREFRKKVESISDIVLCGHEHVSDFITVIDNKVNNIKYQSGGLLQCSNQDMSNFNVIIVDYDKSKIKSIKYKYKDNLYTPHSMNDESKTIDEIPWSEFAKKSYLSPSSFTITSEMTTFLNDLGINSYTNDRKRISLIDLYIPPRLKIIQDIFSDEGEKSEIYNIVDDISNDNPCFIYGDYQSGKTSLAKYLFNIFYENNLIPIYIDMRKHKHDADIKSIVENEFKKQYSYSNIEIFHQTSKSNIVLLIDNFHFVLRKSRNIIKRINNVLDIYKKVVLFALDIDVKASNYSSRKDSLLLFNKNSSMFNLYKILPFNNSERELLIEKWLNVNENDYHHYAENIIKRRESIDDIIEDNIELQYPVYTLTFLMMYESNMLSDDSIPSHGHYYELLINMSMFKDNDDDDIEDAFAFLSYLAYRMLKETKNELSFSDYENIKNAYLIEYKLTTNLDKMKEYLLRHHILESDSTYILFKYPYIFYYFSSLYLHQHIDEDEIREFVISMIDNLEVSDNSQIILYLIHLTRNPFIIEKLLGKAKNIFPEYNDYDFNSSIEFITSLKSDFAKIEFKERDLREVRHERNKTLDELDEKFEEMKKSDTNENECNRNIIFTSMYTVKILGQIFKNYSGSIRANIRNEIVQESYSALARINNHIVNCFCENSEELIQIISEHIFNNSKNNITKDQADKKSSKLITHLVYGIIISITGHAARNLGSKQNQDLIYDTMDSNNELAFQLFGITSITTSSTSLPVDKVLQLYEKYKDNYYTSYLIKLTVHLLITNYPIDFSQRRRVCNALEINYSSTIRFPKKDKAQIFKEIV